VGLARGVDAEAGVLDGDAHGGGGDRRAVALDDVAGDVRASLERDGDVLLLGLAVERDRRRAARAVLLVGGAEAAGAARQRRDRPLAGAVGEDALLRRAAEAEAEARRGDGEDARALHRLAGRVDHFARRGGAAAQLDGLLLDDAGPAARLDERQL